MPAANAHAAAIATAITGDAPVSEPANTASPTSPLAASIRRARCAYGSSLSEKATLSAPVPTTSPLETLPVATPTASGSATPNVFRRASHGATLSAWKRTKLRQNAVHPLAGFPAGGAGALKIPELLVESSCDDSFCDDRSCGGTLIRRPSPDHPASFP